MIGDQLAPVVNRDGVRSPRDGLLEQDEVTVRILSPSIIFLSLALVLCLCLRKKL